MNLILEKDGILGFTGTKSEFGQYLSELKKEPGQGGRHCWTSCPASTIMSMLGLCQYMPTPERPTLAFHGSPVVLMLSMILDNQEVDPVLDSLKRRLELGKGTTLEVAMLRTLGHFQDLQILHSELEEAFSYLDVT